MRSLQKIIIHCSATPEGRDVQTKEIKQWHLDRGWSDIGYHFVIQLDGSIHDGRPVELSGAHAKGHNADSIGICYVGGVDEDGEPKDTRGTEQVSSLLDLVLDLRASYGKQMSVHGHNEFSEKACPSFDVQEEFQNIGDIEKERNI
mgnify:FL=1|tara:strand:+ start:277 stop:714 length:438 start_codon:yes stop_codon:yes gene_type:complete